MNLQTFNYIEAGLWFLISLALLTCVCIGKMSTAKSRNAIIAALAFFAFGISDLIEARTGRWWDPVPLLALNIGCVVVLLICFVRHRRL